MKKYIQMAESVAKIAERYDVIPTVLTRLTIASVFIMSGWGKLQHLDKVIDFFESLGIPFASMQAPLVAGAELVCGIAILVGLGARYASIPLMVIMLVAMRTAKWEDVGGVSSLAEFSEFLYFVLLTWIAVFGAGKFSVDNWLSKKYFPAETKKKT